ncbi:ABC transporter [Pontibacillus halophilus JSM 076056 = DSM 19796]|uniref:Carnitine transport ATP-binding protein OpuCA n=1 Tax=Pontibacillus halophilus JSM 076056 = DSM 19796 TaxID=1385510 RepID=A0A0A5I402_9BACI|nr:ABC transporter ATP-binding protein [Pontibacillus halophilus]KGX90537.1 ABC transporter [Pontibacillus halophilus JSM 076056 = DSM 19796]
MTKPYLSLQQASKAFHHRTVLEHIHFSMEKGEILSIVGPSGSGKSTLLRCLAGLETFSTGKLYINGQDVTDVEANKRSVSYVFQQPLLFPHMNILQNIGYGLQFKKVSKQKRKELSSELLQQIGLRDYATAYPHELSGGQQQRVSLARSLAVSPDLLLLDEPFSSLDQQLRIEMRAWVRQFLKAEGTTAIFITHDREEAMMMGDRVAVFQDGRFQQVGEPQAVYRKPATPFVAKFYSDTLLLDDTRYIPVHCLKLQKSNQADAFKATVQHPVFVHGKTLYTVFVQALDQRVTLEGDLTLEVNETVYLSYHARDIQTFHNDQEVHDETEKELD